MLEVVYKYLIQVLLLLNFFSESLFKKIISNFKTNGLFW